MTASVLKLADRVDDVRFDTVRETMERAQAFLSAENSNWHDHDFNPTSCVLIFLDEKDATYRFKLMASALRISEIIALLELAKAREIRDQSTDDS